jgi:hypothetical protein
MLKHNQFLNMEYARDVIEAWEKDHNNVRPPWIEGIDSGLLWL